MTLSDLFRHYRKRNCFFREEESIVRKYRQQISEIHKDAREKSLGILDRSHRRQKEIADLTVGKEITLEEANWKRGEVLERTTHDLDQLDAETERKIAQIQTDCLGVVNERRRKYGIHELARF